MRGVHAVHPIMVRRIKTGTLEAPSRHVVGYPLLTQRQTKGMRQVGEPLNVVQRAST